MPDPLVEVIERIKITRRIERIKTTRKIEMAKKIKTENKAKKPRWSLFLIIWPYYDVRIYIWATNIQAQTTSTELVGIWPPPPSHR